MSILVVTTKSGEWSWAGRNAKEAVTKMAAADWLAEGPRHFAQRVKERLSKTGVAIEFGREAYGEFLRELEAAGLVTVEKLSAGEYWRRMIEANPRAAARKRERSERCA